MAFNAQLHKQVDPLQREERDAAIELRNNRLGMTIFQISWMMAFVCLIVVNWQLRFRYATWPPTNVEPLSPSLPTVATIGLLVSAGFVRRGLRAIQRDLISTFRLQWQIAIGLGIGFVVIMLYEFMTVSSFALETQYGVVFRLMTGFHGTHALVIGLLLMVTYRRGIAGKYHAENSWAVEGTAKLWYFVVIAWILFYLVLYWI